MQLGIRIELLALLSRRKKNISKQLSSNEEMVSNDDVMWIGRENVGRQISR